MHDRARCANVRLDGPSKPTRGIPRSFSLPMLLLPTMLWIWLCRDWPERLGFFSDDWMVLLHPFVGTAEAYRDVMNLVATRPVSAPFIWFAQTIVDWSPIRSQLLNAVMLMVTAASIGMLSAALVSSVRGIRAGGTLAGACIAGASFIVFPSTIGTFAWGTGVSTVIPALPLFCLATSVLVHSGNSWTRLGAGLVLAALSHLSYEAFYFQEIVLIVLATVLRGSGVKEIHWRAILGAMLVNVGCIAFNRLTPGGIQKTFHWDFFHLFVWGYRHLPGAFSDATRNHTVLITASMFVAGLSGSFCLAQLIGAARVRLAFLVTMCGIAVSGFLYAFAGYHLVMQGPLARVSIVLASYYALASGVLAAAAWRPPSWRAWPVIAFWLFAATGLVAFELSARAQVTEWADTWSYELARLLRLPEAITAGEQFPGAHQRIYLAIDQRPVSTVEPATAPWEIIGAIAWASERSTNKRSMMVDRWKGSQTTPQWFAAPKEWFNRWNGRNFEQGPCGGAAAFSASGSELWLWQTSANTLSKVGAPWEYGCH